MVAMEVRWVKIGFHPDQNKLKECKNGIKKACFHIQKHAFFLSYLFKSAR